MVANSVGGGDQREGGTSLYTSCLFFQDTPCPLYTLQSTLLSWAAQSTQVWPEILLPSSPPVTMVIIWTARNLPTHFLFFVRLEDRLGPCSPAPPHSSKQCPATADYNMTSHKLYPIYFYGALSPVKIGLVPQFPPFSSWKERGTDKPQFNLFWQLLEISHRERSPCLSVQNDIQPYGPRQKETPLFCKSIQACIDILAEVPAHSNLNGEKRETRTFFFY